MILYLHPRGEEEMLDKLATEANQYLKPLCIDDIENLSGFVMYSQGSFINSNFFVLHFVPAEMSAERKSDFIRAIQNFKCLYSARLILVLPGLDKDSELMSKVVAENIRNLITCSDMQQILEECRTCLSDDGKEFQDTAHLIAQERVNLARDMLRPHVEPPEEPFVIHVGGVMNRIGTTTQCFSVYRYLEWLGLKCCYIDMDGRHMQNLGALYQQTPQDGFLDVADLQLYTAAPGGGYHALVFDFGVLSEQNLAAYLEPGVKLLCCGSKAWELPPLAELLMKSSELAAARMVFSFTPDSERAGAAQMLSEVTDRVYFAPYAPDILGKSPDTGFYNSMLLKYLQGEEKEK